MFTYTTKSKLVKPYENYNLWSVLTKLQFLQASPSEFSVISNYLDWLTALSWGKYRFDEYHYGLTDVGHRRVLDTKRHA
jgi:ATP-dependent Lon protease